MSSHPTCDEDFDLYALGALEGTEKQALESHVAFCLGCAQKLADARGRIAILALATPAARAPVNVKERLLEQIRAAREGGAILTELKPQPARRPGMSRWTAILLPIAAVLAIAAFLLWNANRRLDIQLTALRASMQQEQRQLQDARDIASLITARDTITVQMAPQQAAMPHGTAHVMYNAKMGMMMYDGQIPPAPAAKSYQLWLVPASGKPISCGVFNPVEGQPDHWMTKLPKGIQPKSFAVTLEPSGGMPQPTGPKVLVGAPS
ncbi:MAG TPA: anti-sigma factor [Verrucomicrobiae bacterium]|nr:anti-sigma factor [Verrucomicrobiae bacterium]